MRLRRIGLVALAFSVAACGSDEKAPAPERNRVVIGMMGGVQPGKPNVIPALNGMQLAAAEYNRDPDSTFQVRIKRVETDGTEPVAAAAATELAKAPLLIGVVGPFSEPEASSAGPILEKEGIPFLTTSESSASLPQPDWRSFRRLVASDREEGRILSRRTEGTVVVFHDGTGEGRAFAEGAREGVEKSKRQVAGFDRISPSTNVEGLSGAVVETPPGAVIYGGEGALGRALADGLRKAGYKGPLFLSHQVLTQKTEGLPDGLLTSSVAADPSDRATAAFGRRYRKVYASRQGQFAIEAYEGALMLLEAAEEVEPKPKQIAEFFQLNPGFLGDAKAYEYQPNGELKDPPVWLYESRAGGWSSLGRSKPFKPRSS